MLRSISIRLYFLIVHNEQIDKSYEDMFLHLIIKNFRKPVN